MKMRFAILLLLITACPGRSPAAEEEAGFQPLFDGKTLNGWEAPDMTYWSVEDGAITAKITKDHPCSVNQYLVWKEPMDDFELKLTFRITGSPGTNGGFQFRSRLLPNHDMAGYQMDNNRDTPWLARLYEEHGRETLAFRGKKAVIEADGKTTLSDLPEAGGPAWFKLDQWHQYHLICRGPHLVLNVNGRLAAEVLDGDAKRYAPSGLLGLQLHSGPPMTVQFKDIRLKRLKAVPATTARVHPEPPPLKPSVPVQLPLRRRGDEKSVSRTLPRVAGTGIAMGALSNVKTLVAWVYLSNTTQRGGSAFTLEDPNDHFDAIVFGEIQPGRWMAGSDGFLRSHQDQAAWPVEKADARTLVQIAIVYFGKEVTIYRNGQLYAKYAMNSEPMAFGPDSLVLMGLRHRAAGGGRFFAGAVEDARIYNTLLDPAQIAALKPNQPSDPKPLAWWSFESGKAEDLMGRFPPGHLLGGAKIADGKLHLNGQTSYLLIGADPPRTRQTEDWPTWHITALAEEGVAIPYDANGCIFWKGRYHLMYIYQDPERPQGGHCWGHASSTDLVNWTFHPPAIVPEPGDPDVGIFSGNAFVNKEGKPMLCWFGINAGVCVATAEDDGLIRWRKHPKNPIVPIPKPGQPGHGVYNVWDPYLWLEGDTYMCLLGGNLHKGKDTLYLCTSPDLVNWKPIGPFYEQPDPNWTEAGEDCSCPDFFKLGDKRVLMCISHKIGARCYVGRYDNGKFLPERHVRMNWPGGMFFAPESLEDAKGRRIFWAWVTDPRIRPTMDATGSGAQSMPRVLGLEKDGTLRITPAEELQALRRNHRAVAKVDVPADGEAALKDVRGDCLELALEIDPGKAREVGVKVRCSPDGREETAIRYDPAAKKLILDMSRSTLRKDVVYSQPPFAAYFQRRVEDVKPTLKTVEAPLELRPGETLKLRIFLDKPMLEVFANDRQCITQQIFPESRQALAVKVFARGGAAMVRGGDAWDMAPATFINRKNDPTAAGHYRPRGMSVWDTWYLQRGETTHLFHLQIRREGSFRPADDEGSIGHATSDDLLHWKELPVVLRKGPGGSYDDSWALFTGCAVEHDRKIHLFYCANHEDAGRCNQTMCLATSEDGLQFERHPGNPILEPDRKRYYSIHEPPPPFPYHARPHIDCRDLAVVKDPSGSGWLGYVVMRRKGQQDSLHSSCIALCRSKDLVHWEVGDPCCTPNRFNCFEVPDVFRLGDKWYMIALTGDGYGQSQRWSDPNITAATVVFQADTPEGPFEEVKDNLLLASRGQQGYSARTLQRNGDRLMLYTRSEGRFGRLSWPVKLVPRPGGGLLPMYWHGCDRAFGPGLSVAAIELQGAGEAGAYRCLDSWPKEDRTCMLTATVSLRGAKRAGLAFRRAGDVPDAPGYVALLDAEHGEVVVAKTPGFAPVQQRRWEIKASGTYKLRVLAVREMLEVYVDDVLVLQCYEPGIPRGAAAVFAQGGAAAFRDLTYQGEAPCYAEHTSKKVP